MTLSAPHYQVTSDPQQSGRFSISVVGVNGSTLSFPFTGTRAEAEARAKAACRTSPENDEQARALGWTPGYRVSAASAAPPVETYEERQRRKLKLAFGSHADEIDRLTLDEIRKRIPAWLDASSDDPINLFPEKDPEDTMAINSLNELRASRPDISSATWNALRGLSLADAISVVKAIPRGAGAAATHDTAGSTTEPTVQDISPEMARAMGLLPAHGCVSTDVVHYPGQSAAAPTA